MKTPFATEELARLVGVEARMAELGYATTRVASRLAARNVSTLQVTCSDPREKQAADAFQTGVVRELVRSTVARQSPVRAANLGGRYEWGAAPIAVRAFRDDPSGSSLAIVQINTHVGFERSGAELRFGTQAWDSAPCAALTQLLNGVAGPFGPELEALFASEGVDRLAMLRDPARVPAASVPLFTSIVSARLQARQAMLDLTHGDDMPDQLLVQACVSLNQKPQDHLLLVGFYAGSNLRGPGQRALTWTGLCDDPARLVLDQSKHEFRVHALSANGVERPNDSTRPARGPANHRDLPRDAWLARSGQEQPTGAAHESIRQLIEGLETSLADPDHPGRNLAIKALLVGLGEVLPIPALLLLFAGGGMELHHAWRMHNAAQGKLPEAEARRLLAQATDQLDDLSLEEHAEMLSVLKQRFGG